MRPLAFALLLVLPVAGCGQPTSAPEVADAWMRASPGGATTAAVYMTITAPTADRLVGASTVVAERTDLMTMEVDGTAMTMAYVDAIDLPADTAVSLDPSGLHVWLAGVDRPLAGGETFPLSLEFEKGGRQEVTVSVIGPAAAPPGSGMQM